MKAKIITVVSGFIILLAIMITAIVLLGRSDVHEVKPEETSGAGLAQFYDTSHKGKPSSPILMTGSAGVDYAIEEITDDNGFESFNILKQWQDANFDAECYFVLFDDSILYCIKETSDGEIFYSESDYEFYKEVYEEDE